MKRRPGIFSLLKPYRGLVGLLVFFSLLSNGTSLVLPRLIGLGINDYTSSHQVPVQLFEGFALACLAIVSFTFLQSLVQIYTSEQVALNLRTRLAEKIATQSYLFVQKTEPSRLLTNLTSDVDAIKTFVADVIAGLLSSFLILGGATLLLLKLNWRLALAVLGVIPIIAVSFALVIMTLRPIFRQTREVIDALNKVINESVLGAALIRVVNGTAAECQSFEQRNSLANKLGLIILGKFAMLIPLVSMVVQIASVIILALGGRFVIQGSMTVGDLATFNGYLALVIFPIFVIGFMNTLIAQASAAYERLSQVLEAPGEAADGGLKSPLLGHLEARNLCLSYAERPALQDVSLTLKAGTRTAVIGPTAAGKTQLLYVLTGLLPPESGEILYDGHKLEEYDRTHLHRQVALVFQESILFNMSIRDNVAFTDQITPEAWQRALDTAEMSGFLEGLPEGADTIVSERGTSLSGGQKQRLMLARALALEPKILLLDDFTARVDPNTERKILDNLRRNYPDMTLLAVTQRIATIQDYDHILLLMEGQLLAQGTHHELLETSPEYMQIFESQKSTQEYELSTDS